MNTTLETDNRAFAEELSILLSGTAVGDALAIFCSTDELGLVVRGHLYIEQLIKDYLKAKTHRPPPFGKTELTYHKVLQMAFARGLPIGLEQPLRKLCDMRNNFAHTAFRQITSEDVGKIYSRLSIDLQAFTAIDCAARSGGLMLAQQPPLDQFRQVLAVLYALVNVFVIETKKTAVFEVARSPKLSLRMSCPGCQQLVCISFVNDGNATQPFIAKCTRCKAQIISVEATKKPSVHRIKM